jgi:glyoxylase-like metal-dependent hydrolase (beta-lactamase superfamily II)
MPPVNLQQRRQPQINLAITPLALKLPERGELTAIDDDIYWLRMPLPFDLDHINLYLIKDGEGYAALDTGIGTQTTEAIWEDILADLGKPLTRVIVTHMHPDHIGMAGYLTEKFRVPLYMSMSEYFVARAMVSGGRGASDWQDREYLIRCGMNAEYVEKAAANKGGMQKVVRPIPLSYKRMSEGMKIPIGAHVWEVLIGRGHSPEHVCLYCQDKNTLISGDHVLPKISPNIGVYSTEPDANALDLYLTTLPQFKSLPMNTKVLPSHKLPFTGLHTRVDQLIEHHQGHLTLLRDFCKKGKTVSQCLPVLFKRELNPHNMFFALAEGLAHLNYLYFEGECTRELAESGHWIFTTADAD